MSMDINQLMAEMTTIDQSSFNDEIKTQMRAGVMAKFSAVQQAAKAEVGNSDNGETQRLLRRMQWWQGLGAFSRYDANKSKSFTHVTMGQRDLEKLFQQSDMMAQVVSIEVRFPANYSPPTSVVVASNNNGEFGF